MSLKYLIKNASLLGETNFVFDEIWIEVNVSESSHKSNTSS
jgi:hypothetical protein